jgi:hypothetical protein
MLLKIIKNQNKFKNNVIMKESKLDIEISESKTASEVERHSHIESDL